MIPNEKIDLVLLLCFVFALCTTSVHNVSSEENSALKVSNELRTPVSSLAPNDTFLIWLDVYSPPLPDGNIYLSSSDIYPITDLGAKIAGVTFSPDEQLLWYLVEARAMQVSNLANLPTVRNVSIAMIGIWDWWDKPWRNVTPIDPLLNITAQRVARGFANASVRVVINYADVVLNRTEKSKQEISGEISALVKSVGGKVARIGLAEYVLAEVPPNELSRLFENEYVRTLEAVQPLYVRVGSFRKSASYPIQYPLLMLLLPFCVACYSMRKPRKARLALIISLLLATSLLFSFSVPSTYALNVSRPAIRADQTGFTGNGVTVAVIDTGIDFNHGYLAPAILASVDLTGQNDPMDYNGHGTHVAGIVVSRSGPYTGIAHGSSIINVKIGLDWTLIGDGIQWCINNKDTYNIGVIQLSYGQPTEQPGDGTDPLSMKADDAVEAGIAVIVAVMDSDTNGNGIYELSNPEQAFNVIAVGAVKDQNTVGLNDDTMASHSAGGSTTDGRPKPDVVAPGGRTDNPLIGIWSTRSAQAPAGNYEAINGVYGRMSGTSMAAPHVSGTVALMLEANPNLTPAQVKAILRQTANLTNNLNGDARAGHGIIDAFAAVQLAQNVGNIQISQMYDSWDVTTPGRDLGWWCYDYLTFTMDAPSSTYGVSTSDVQYHYRHPLGWGNTDYKLMYRLSAQHVWINGTYYPLGSDMHKYLFTGPRIYLKAGNGVVCWRAWYQIGNVRIEYDWLMGVEQIVPRLVFYGMSSWKALMYMDIDVWDSTNYAYLPSTSETVLTERKITGAINVTVRDLDHGEYILINPPPQYYGNPTMWILRYGYFGNNPDATTVKNDEYVYNRDIVIYSQLEGEHIGGNNAVIYTYRKTDALPAPNPTQNDVGTGGDAGNTFSVATSINPGSYNGILCNSESDNGNDYYKFNVTSGQYIYAGMTPPCGINFDLQLYNPSNNLKAGSYLGGGTTDSIFFKANSTGQWRIRINTTTGEAQYSFYLSINSNAYAMKTLTNGYFYVPNVATGLLKIEMLFDNQNITGDQTGGTSPYGTIATYPDGKVDIHDVSLVSSKYGFRENRSGWDYMADVYPDRKTDIQDTARVSGNFGKFGTYITSLAGVTVTFSTGEEKSPDSDGFVVIPQGATNFTVKRNGTLIGAMITFW